jgi:hypothetical protein
MQLGAIEKRFISYSMSEKNGHEKIENFVNENKISKQYKQFEIWLAIYDASCSTKYTSFTAYHESIEYKNKIRLKKLFPELL